MLIFQIDSAAIHDEKKQLTDAGTAASSVHASLHIETNEQLEGVLSAVGLVSVVVFLFVWPCVYPT